MAAQYPLDAIRQCLRFYLDHNGQQHDLIEKKMQKAGWSGWKKQNLYDRGKGKQTRLGWISKYGFEKALRIHVAQLPTPSLNNAQKLVSEIETVRELLYSEIQGKTEVVEKERLQLHRDYCNLSIAALAKVEAAKDTLGAWVHFWERLLDWSVDVDIKLARTLKKHSPELISRAEEEFGESEEQVMNGNPDPTNAEALAAAEG
jgi:hypothetical protein